MTKKILLNVIIGLCVFITAVIIAYVAVTYMTEVSHTSTQTLPAEHYVSAETTDLPKNVDANCDCYLAQFNGKDISLYACTGNNKEFLYTISIRPEDISADELEKLKNGIILPTKEALASFEEDFS